MAVSSPVVLMELARHFLCPVHSLNLAVCVGRGGQSFTWQQITDSVWCNSLAEHLVILGQDDDDDQVYFQSPSNPDVIRAILWDYFRLDEDLDALCQDWCTRDPVFKKILPKVHGIRVLRIEPWECLVSFICSQNNSIPRILKMVSSLKTCFGNRLCELLLSDMTIIDIFSFPSAEHLSSIVDLESKLRAMSFGYRAGYIQKAIEHVISASPPLQQWRILTYDQVIERLLQVPGVGPKVADCVALYGLDQLCAVPIDTHILRVALTHYCPRSQVSKSLTPAAYRKVSARLREALGSKAGWAQSVLFTGQLAFFKNPQQG